MRAKLPILFVTLLVTAVAAQRSQSDSIETERIFEAIGVREGITVCEMGAGDGALSLAAARAVGSGGRVYTSELGDDRVKALRERAASSGLAHITVISGDPVKTNFPDETCDALFMRNVYHHFAEPAQINRSITTSLKPGARVAIVDFAPPGNEAERPADRGNDGMHGVTPVTVTRELKEAGLEVTATEDGSGRWFMVVATKPKS